MNFQNSFVFLFPPHNCLFHKVLNFKKIDCHVQKAYENAVIMLLIIIYGCFLVITSDVLFRVEFAYLLFLKYHVHDFNYLSTR